ncbi:MAG: preprotein translocase subunit SecG [Epsilonproteobacteria bacterium]|nr:preprotein translocase subunit SecG [Campylobacterota bacterium]NPA56733.1 preprotein translocase subunit SecG [Campylobacterota bacterium]
MIKVLFIMQIVLAVILTIVILLQKSSSIGLGAYSGSNESLFGAKGPQGFLAKTTFFLATLFVLNTIALGYLYNKAYNQSVVDKIEVEKKSSPIPAPPPVTQEESSAPEAPTPR